MKKGLLFLIICLASINLTAQEWVGCPQQSPAAPKVKLMSDTEQKTELSFTLGGFFKEEVNTPKGLQYIIKVPKMASMLEEGSPDLPLYAIPVLIDDLAAMEVQVKEAKYQDFEGIEIAPSKGNFSREINPDEVPFRYGDAYAQNRFFPGFQAQLDQPYILRDFRGQNILVYPFAYNPISKTLRVYTQLTLEMRKTGENGSNAKLSRKSSQTRMTAEANAMYQQRFVNYRERASKYNFVPDEGEMLVICPPEFLDAMQPFVAWKNESGRPTTLVNLSDIGGNNTDQIKSFILSHYNNPDENLCYVLLVGDYNQITPKAMSDGASDIWFGQLEGNDYYPEVFVGRFSAENEAHVQNQVAKVIYYERDIAADADWLSKGIGVGSVEGAGSGHNGGESDYQHVDYIRDTLMHYTYTEVSRHYHGVGAGTNASMLSQNFNEGAGICNYCNHGSTTGWYVGNFNNYHVNTLTNDYKLPFIWSTACYNGQFNVNCFAEAWLRATNNVNGAPTGAIGGMFSWTSQPWQPPMTGQDEMVDILCEWRSADQFHHTFGGASLNGNMRILDMYPNDQGKTHNTWILFGDPSLLLRTEAPSELNVICQPEAIFLGLTELFITADADYAIATLSNNGEILASAPIVNGEGVLTFDGLTEIGNLQLVVTSYNKVTEVRDIAVIPNNGAYLTCESVSINDENGQADYGDTVGINVTVKNLGNLAATNVQATLSTDSPFVEVTHGSANIPNVASLEQYTIANAFEIAVNELIPDGSQAEFFLSCTDGIDTWTSRFRVALHAPNLVISEFRPFNTTYPGEVGDLVVGIRNTGSSDARNVKIELYSSHNDLVFNPIIHNVGEIAAGSAANVTASFNTSSNIPNGSNFEVYYAMDAKPYSYTGTKFLNIGPIKETFETGDFSAFDWESLGGAPWIVDSSTANSGTYSARSGAIGNGNLTTLQVEVEIVEDGEISFFLKTSSEGDKDKLTFYIDNETEGVWSGVTDWTSASFSVNSGIRRFRWIYMKDSSGSYGEDCCWIDDIQFPSAHTFTLLPVLELETQVEENKVTLSWQPQNPTDDYLIRRNGTPIAMQHETTFTEWLNLGTHTYSVTAVSSEGLQSIPAFATVEITVLGVDSIENTLRVFPNPVRGYLNISFEQPFSYRLFNSIGQHIWEGESSGDLQMDCRVLSQGVYILLIATETEDYIKKIIVQ
jgi:hypothetical protein